MSNKIIFSGVQPTGEIHIGNYLGAISQFVSNQDEYKSIFSIVDLHAITIPQNPKELLNRTRQVLAIFLASGIDPTKNIIFNQSQVAEHTQLAWILNCTARVGWLNRMTQFKDKAGKNKENASIGLYTYPILMAELGKNIKKQERTFRKRIQVNATRRNSGNKPQKAFTINKTI